MDLFGDDSAADKLPESSPAAATRPAIGEDKQAFEREIFGGEGDALSDLSDEEDVDFLDDQADEGAASSPLPTVAVATAQQAKKKISKATEDLDEVAADDDLSPAGRDGLEDVREQTEARKLARRKRIEAKRKRRAERRNKLEREGRDRTEGDDLEAKPELPPMMQEFEDVVNSMKGRRNRVEYDEMGADEFIIQVVNAMRVAAADDIEANSERKPAKAKLKLLPKVLALLEKSYMHDQLLENEMLTSIRIWLEPLPDGSLPAISIRKPLLSILSKLPIDSDLVRESRIGRVVMFYYKCDRELPDLRKMAADLIGQWSRPILQKLQVQRTSSTTYDDAEDNHAPKQYKASADGRSRAGDVGYEMKTARIPQPLRATYSVAPKSNVTQTYKDKVFIFDLFFPYSIFIR